MTACRNITILGSTGTIGINTLDVISRNPDRYRVFALTANSDSGKMFDQCARYRPEYAVMTDPAGAEQLQRKLRAEGFSGISVLSGAAGLERVAGDSRVDCVMAAIVGAAGLLPTLAAARAGKRVLLANKESLVMSGQLFMETVRNNGATLLPIDSEHNAIWQCVPCFAGDGTGLPNGAISKIWLTASGGPFRKLPLETLDGVTPEQACAHPNWKMGRKISVDSATMMNKGLELIEARWLFGTEPESIQVVLHPQSIIHSMVAYSDGSVLAQMGNPDMRIPIAYALAWPDRIPSGAEPLDIFKVAELNFERPDLQRFPCLGLAYDALRRGGTATTILNAANEIAVDNFLQGRIRYTDIVRIVASALENLSPHEADSLEAVLEDDKLTRAYANDRINAMH
ncbi:MAG TPA: 1-deoxy-D-xylulose-5-phosphate reductoisomerase [Gammaproteobacteria bacterium]|nr:1-deoxy-D-xylulose-5-phosphate reductoisomerase [Gammaproteobacteria bacterium]